MSTGVATVTDEAAVAPVVSPCVTCGACCVTYRVSFYCGEMDAVPGGWVPSELVEKVTPVRAAMKGTGRMPPRCIALEGVVGESVSCTIYDKRPSPCRDFGPKASLGLGDEDCNRARSIHGLPPLPLE